jgi:large subunit ribosomal protein L22
MPKAAAKDVAKVIRSAQANAEHNFNLVKDDLVLKEIRVEPGPMMKRGQPRAMGRLFSIFKRTSHITAIVEDRPGAVRRRRPTPQRAAAAAAPAPAAPARGQAPKAEAKPRAEKAAPKKEQPEKGKAKSEARTTEARKKEEPKKEREKKEKGK